jgi:hypothetical protein
VNPPAPRGVESVEVPLSTIDAVAETVLGAVARVLQRHPDLAAMLQVLLRAPPSLGPPRSQAFASVAQYAAYRSVSERTVRYDLSDMEEGKHFHRAGRKGGRVVIHVQEADAWYAQRGSRRDVAANVEELAIDEVTRRRARVALKKRKERG